MGFFSFLDPVFDFLFGWMLNLDPFWSIMILSFLMSLLVIVITKLTTDQNLMKHLKDESKELQKQMKALKDKPDEMMKIQKVHMESSMKYMKHSFRPLIFTFIPIILIFGWINAHLAWEPISIEKEFSVEIEFEKGMSDLLVQAEAPEGIELTSNENKTVSDGITIFTFKALEPGFYTSPGLMFHIDGKTYTKDIRVTDERYYEPPIKSVRDRTVKNIETIHDKVEVINIGSFSLSWLWSYIIFSIVFSSVLRKLMKVY